MNSVPNPKAPGTVSHTLLVRRQATATAKAAGCDHCAVIDAAVRTYRATGNRFDAVRAARAEATRLATASVEQAVAAATAASDQDDNLVADLAASIAREHTVTLRALPAPLPPGAA